MTESQKAHAATQETAYEADRIRPVDEPADFDLDDELAETEDWDAEDASGYADEVSGYADEDPEESSGTLDLAERHLARGVRHLQLVEERVGERVVELQRNADQKRAEHEDRE